ncbi:hypothetical protein AB0D08_27130 [Kitasatospora sp. NPDC048540]|uniref:hypothetical protein n=1 Tax=unclassified Kitasatospora TaxID=2633591 RepID=UPI000539ABC6|nr:hypothetical protein [Kitasatospora sp. MBT63]
MTTAHQLFAEGIRDHFAPALRALGFTGGPHSFTLPDPTRRVLLDVRTPRPQPAGPDGGRSVRYTLGLAITPKSAGAGPPAWRAGIGELLPVGGEVWWEVAPGPRWLVAVEDSVAAVRHYALPELLRRLAGPDAAGYLSRDELAEVNAALALAAVPRIGRAELLGGALLLHGAWSRADPVAREVLEAAALGFLSAGDDRFDRVRCLDTLGRALWVFEARPG